MTVYTRMRIKAKKLTTSVLCFLMVAVLLPDLSGDQAYAASSTLIHTVAGTGSAGYSGDAGAATLAQINTPKGVAVDSSGNLYIADSSNHRIRKVDSFGNISTVAGTGEAGYSGDGGAATSAKLSYPSGVAVDSSGNLYITDTGNSRIRMVDTAGNISKVAGTGGFGYSGDGGLATSATLGNVQGIAVDSSGNVFFSDVAYPRIRKIDTSGNISTVAGTGTTDYSGDGGLATSAHLNHPYGVAVDNSGNLYIADYGNNRIRKVDTAGNISTVAGTGVANISGDGGLATSAAVIQPLGVAVDNSGNVYISTYQQIRKIDADGIISTAAGSGAPGYSGDGVEPTSASLYYPYGVAVDSNGDMYIPDTNNSRIRKVGPASSNAYLSSLTLSDGVLSPAFASGVTEYTAVADDDTFTVTPIASDNYATVTVNETPVTRGETSEDIGFSGGSSTVTIKVTAQDGTTSETYTVIVTREEYTVTYIGNGSTGGSVPTDSNSYLGGTAVTVQNNTGSLTKEGYTFSGWNTQADGKGTSYAEGDNFSMGTGNVRLYAQWNWLAHSAPFTLSAEGGNEHIDLDWSAVAGATSYDIYQSTESGVYGSILDYTVTGETFDYSVADLENGTTYYFVVKAIDVFGDVVSSTEASATPQSGVLPVLNTVHIASSNTKPTVARTGDTVTLTFTANKELKGLPAATIAGQAANVISLGENSYSADYTFTGEEVEGKVAFTIDFSDMENYIGAQVTATTDGSSVSYKKKSMPSDSSTGSSQTQIITVNVEQGGNAGAVVATAEIVRTTDVNGRVEDAVTFGSEQAERTIQQLAAAGSNRATIVIPDPKDEVSELNVIIPKASARLLAEGGVSLEINTANAKIIIPNDSLQGLTEDIYFRVVPVKEKSKQEEIELRAQTEQVVREAFDDNAEHINIIGRPMTIETNMQSRQVTLVLPLEERSYSEAELLDMGVYIEHSDGEIELAKGEVVAYDRSGKLSIQFTINKFSTFTIVHMEGWSQLLNGESDLHEAYIHGYPDGSFGPERSITRAEMAAMLVRVIGKGGRADGIAYLDVAQTHWAKNEIGEATMLGLMTGYPDGSFKPDQQISRAEMAAIIARITNASDSVTDGSFMDISGHWAQGAIVEAQSAGIMSGYSDGTFRPDQPLTRAEAVVTINRLLDRGPLSGAPSKWSDVSEQHWAYAHIQEASISHNFEALIGGGEKYAAAP